MAAPGEDAGLPALFNAHYRTLLALAVLVTDDRATAEDLVQEAFARLHGRHLADPSRALAYLRSTVLNLSRRWASRFAVSTSTRPAVTRY